MKFQQRMTTAAAMTTKRRDIVKLFVDSKINSAWRDGIVNALKLGFWMMSEFLRLSLRPSFRYMKDWDYIKGILHPDINQQ
jgi:hypothetical protein